MSIIEETLRKLQESQSDGKTQKHPPASINPESPWSGQVTPPGSTFLKLRFLAISLLVVLIAAGLALFGGDIYDTAVSGGNRLAESAKNIVKPIPLPSNADSTPSGKNLKQGEENLQTRLAEIELTRRAEKKKINAEAKKAEQAWKLEKERLEKEAILAEKARKVEATRIAEKNRIEEEARKAEEVWLAEKEKLAEKARQGEKVRLLEKQKIERKVALAQQKWKTEQEKISEANRQKESLWKDKIEALKLKAKEAESRQVLEREEMAKEARVAKERRFAQERKEAMQGRLAEDEPWIQEGWDAFKKNEINDALDIWTDGFDGLDDERIVLLIRTQRNFSSLDKMLKSLGEGHAGFIVEGDYKGKHSYYLLSAPPNNVWLTERDRIVEILDLNFFIKGNSKGKFLANMSSGSGSGRERGIAKERVTAKSSREVAKITPPPTTAKFQDLTPKERMNRGRHEIRLKEYRKAVETLTPVFDSGEATWEAYFLSGTAYLGMGNLDSAAKYLDLGIAMNGKQPQLWLQRAVVSQQSGEHGKALETLEYLKKLSPKMPEVYLNIGYSNDMLKQKDKAKQAYQKFISLTENRPAYINVRKQVIKRLLK